ECHQAMEELKEIPAVVGVVVVPFGVEELGLDQDSPTGQKFLEDGLLPEQQQTRPGQLAWFSGQGQSEMAQEFRNVVPGPCKSGPLPGKLGPCKLDMPKFQSLHAAAGRIGIPENRWIYGFRGLHATP